MFLAAVTSQIANNGFSCLILSYLILFYFLISGVFTSKARFYNLLPMELWLFQDFSFDMSQDL